jgi:hypothetical protein
MYQKRSEVLALRVTCPTTVSIGDVVVISDDLEVAAISSAGSTSILGTVCQHLDDADYCTVETKFREHRDDRVAGAAVAVGPFVWNAAGKAIAYDPDVHDSAAIAGLVVVAGAQPDDVIETVEY